MKKITLLLILLVTVFASNAQIVNTDKKQLPQPGSGKQLTIKTTPMPAAKSSSSTTPPSSQPAEKSLDLYLTDVTVTATKTGTDIYKLQIDYTIMNVDTAAISQGNFGVQGWVALEGSGQPFAAGGGHTVGLSYNMLNPGTKVSGTMFAFNVRLSGTGRPVYLLGITAYPGFKIADQNKAGKRVYFTL